MSYTQFVATASCEFPDNFSLDDYLTSLSDFIANHIDDDNLNDDVRWVFEDYTQQDVIVILNNYIRESGGKLLIECDTECNNGNSGLWDWLCDRIRQDVMTSKLMEINTATINSRWGVECGTSYFLKNGKYIGSDDIQSILEKNLPEVFQ
jgi:hypothetical protein